MQVSASFQYNDLILFDEDGLAKSQYQIRGSIHDKTQTCEGIVDPAFMCSCGAPLVCLQLDHVDFL